MRSAVAHRAKHLHAVTVRCIGPHWRRNRDETVAEVDKNVHVLPVVDHKGRALCVLALRACAHVCTREYNCRIAGAFPQHENIQCAANEKAWKFASRTVTAKAEAALRRPPVGGCPGCSRLSCRGRRAPSPGLRV